MASSPMLRSAVLVLCFLAASLFTRATSAAPTRHTGDCDEYDFIIVGGGTAGIALATRLSQRLPNDRILLLEAGPTVLDDPRINIPGRKGSALGTVYDWNWTTTPQEAANGRTVAVNRGKVLGGTSAINLLCWDRASVADYDAWEAIGNPGWNWKNMIDAMLKVENFTGINTETYGSEGVGLGGPIDTVVNRIQPTQQTYWLPTLKSLGISGNLNSLNGNPLGVELQPSNIDPTGYIRKYATNSYLPEAGPNLEVRDQTLVNKILFSHHHHKHRATAVQLSANETISAKKEIILSAGTIQSPGLLERSGIGFPSILTPLGIPLLHPLPGVGTNLQDHVRINAAYQLKQNYTSFDVLRVNTTFATEQLALYNASLPSLYDFTGSAYLFLAPGPSPRRHRAPHRPRQRNLRLLPRPPSSSANSPTSSTSPAWAPLRPSWR